MTDLRVLVCPHAMEIGGSQLNAIELAAAVRDLGNEVWVYATGGPLLDRIHACGLPFIEATKGRLRPSPAAAVHLHRAIKTRDIDVVHGYEWPPILEAYAATVGGQTRAVAVGTVMSMAVAPFIPRSMPLTVGTAELHERCCDERTGDSVLLEPPVDTRLNRPGRTGRPSALFFRPPGTAQIVLVSRLAQELKLEGILSSIRAVGQLATRRRVRLLVVGDGPARESVRAAADAVNRARGEEVVLLTGELADPRQAYDSADVCLGMGGSALRALAFEKPLIVLGEGGFSEILTSETLPVFLRQGWYGIANLEREDADARLVRHLTYLLDNDRARQRLAVFGRSIVLERYSLEAAAAKQVEMYLKAIRERQSPARQVLDGSQAGLGLVGYKARRHLERARGIRIIDDFNSQRAQSAKGR